MKPRKLVFARNRTPTSLLDFLAVELNLSRNKTKSLLDTRSVLVNDRRVWMAHHKITPGDVVEIPVNICPPGQNAKSILSPDATLSPLPILYVDESCAIVNKPPGVSTNEKNGLESILRIQLGQPTLRAVHRLDSDTSGCILFVTSDSLFEKTVELFAKGLVHKSYSAVAAGKFKLGECSIDKPIDGQRALTHVRTVHCGNEASYLHISIETGRTHQIRRHLAALGHPVLGDRLYGQKRLARSPTFMRVPRQMLHSFSLALPHPATGAMLRTTAPLPADFRRTLTIFCP